MPEFQSDWHAGKITLLEILHDSADTQTDVISYKHGFLVLLSKTSQQQICFQFA